MGCHVVPAPRERRGPARASTKPGAHAAISSAAVLHASAPIDAAVAGATVAKDAATADGGEPSTHDGTRAPDVAPGPTDVGDLLRTRISQLGLRLEGSPVERCIEQLYRELARKGLHRFRPICYLSDEWGCPSGEPVIGIPFYLARPDLAPGMLAAIPCALTERTPARSLGRFAGLGSRPRHAPQDRP